MQGMAGLAQNLAEEEEDECDLCRVILQSIESSILVKLNQHKYT